MSEKKYITAKELIKKNLIKRTAVWDIRGVVYKEIAETAVNMAHLEMKEKAITAAINSCEYKADWCCGIREEQGAILSEPDECKGRECPYIKRFIDALNSVNE